MEVSTLMVKKTGIRFLKLAAASYFGLLICIVAVTPLRFSGSQTLAGVLSSIFGILASMGLFFFLSQREGYRDNDGVNKPPFRRALISTCISVLLYVLFTVIVRYRHPAAAVLATSFAYPMAGVASDTDLAKMAAAHGGWMFLSFLICTLPLIPAMIFGYRFGCKKRQRERDELTSGAKIE